MKHLTGILMFCMSAITFAGEMTQVTITLHPDSTGPVISRHIYGHFSEHLGRCIYNGVWVGEDSDIPNIRGQRKDVVEALREIAIPNLRWPGGCFADEYHWMDGIGPKNKRPKMVNTNWGGITEDNSFGTHEFMDLCDQLGCEPVICGNIGSGIVKEMSEWVQYLTSDNENPMSALRKQNGREIPWKVNFWCVGNEVWGCGGTMSADFYANELARYGYFLKNYGDNVLLKIASGGLQDDYAWTETLMKKWSSAGAWLQNFMGGYSLHYYTVCNDWEKKGSATDFTEKEWFRTLSKTMVMDVLITRHDSVMTLYDPEKKISIMVDEWGNWHDVEPGTNPGFLYQQNSLRDALVAGINLNIFNNHSDRVRMANIAQVVNVLQSVVLTQGNELVKTPTWYVFKLFKPHHDATLIPVSLNSPLFVNGKDSTPAVTASASRDSLGLVHISLTNADLKKNQSIVCDLKGLKVTKVSGEIITADKMNAFNDFGMDEEVFIKSFDGGMIKNSQLQISLPAKSVVMLTLK